MAVVVSSAEFPAPSDSVCRMDAEPRSGEIWDGVEGVSGNYAMGLTPIILHTGSAALNEGFGAVLYGTVHVMPESFIRGLQLGQEVVDCTVWNTLDEAVTLSQITRSGTDGADIDIAAPVNLPPNTSVAGNLTIYESGPAMQDGAFVFVFSNGLTVPLVVQLTRAMPFPFEHNWAAALGYSIAYHTALSANRSQHEQRLSLTSSPVREIRFTVMAKGLKAARLKGALAGANNRTFAVPVFNEPFQVAEVDDTRTVITASTDLAGFWNLRRYCKAIIGLRGDGTGFLRTITAVDVDAGSITTGTAMPDEDLTKLSCFPAFFAMFTSVSLGHVTNDLEEAALTATELAGTVQPEMADLPPLPERFPFDPNWAVEPGLNFALARNLVGYNGTAQENYATIDRDPKTVSYTVTSGTEAAAMTLLDHFCKARGRAARFRFREPSSWLYTARGHLASETQLQVEYTGWTPDRENEQVAFLGASGIQVRTITDHLLNAATGGLTLTLSSPLGEDLGKNEPAYLVLVGRYDIDQLELTFTSSRISRAVIRLKELVQEYDA